MIRVAVSGAAGKMGATTCEAVEGAEDMELTGRADPSLGTDLADVLGEADVVVDFTTPDAAPGNVRACLDAGVSVVVGTSGWDFEPLREVAEGAAAAGGSAKVFVAPNFAIGAVLMIEASRQIAAHMPDCEIVELHRREKLDAPSGTAKHTAQRIEEAGGNVNAVHSVRLPGLLAHQEVIFGGEGQTLTIRHDSLDRHSFMPGVLLAIRRVAELPEPFTVGLETLL
jgi:4-hydroxy-tetrahydrodipicolinate reductase